MLRDHSLVLVDEVMPKPVAGRLGSLYNVLAVIAGTVFIALMAQVRIPLPFTPVPITGQTLAVVLAGACLGSKRGGASSLLYLLGGGLGLPVFTGFGAGIMHLTGPTGGYLFGFLPAAWLVGSLSERGWDRNLRTNLMAMFLGSLVIYAFGFVWLGVFVGFDKALVLGVLPFIPGDILKMLLAAALLPLVWRCLPGVRGTDDT